MTDGPAEPAHYFTIKKNSDNKKTWIIIGSIVGLVVFVIVMIVALGGGSSENPDIPQPEEPVATCLDNQIKLSDGTCENCPEYERGIN